MIMAAELNPLKSKLKATWMAGDYDRFSRFMQTGAEQFFRRLGIPPGSRLLDVGCGAGQVTLIAARAGMRATGCDIAVNWLERARVRAVAEGLDAKFEEGDAEALPYADRQFDAVTSLFGAMFAPQPVLVAAQLVRVCRPGGIIAMGNWTQQGFIGRMLGAIGKYVAPSGMPSPLLWGDESVVRQRFGGSIAGLKCTHRMYRFHYPFGPKAVVDFFRENYGPMARAFGSVEPNAQAELERDLVSLWSQHNQSPAADDTIVDSEYLEVVATPA